MSHLLFISETLSSLGTILIAYMALRVHHRVRKEHKIDEKVFVDMKLEMSGGVIGVAFITFSYLIEVYLYLAI
jgi:uncharacterized protein YuzE